MPIVNTGRFDINYIEEGDGEPVLLIHGLAGDHTAWLPQVAALKDRYRVIAVDHIGCGLSDKPGDSDYDYILERRITDFEALLDRLQLGDALTFGLHDWGGMIAWQFAAHRIRPLDRLV